MKSFLCQSMESSHECKDLKTSEFIKVTETPTHSTPVEMGWIPLSFSQPQNIGPSATQNLQPQVSK